MRILAVGDVSGVVATEYIRRNLWKIRSAYSIDMAVVNGENAAKGNGLDRDTVETLLASGADVITGGNHIWHRHGFKDYIDDLPYVLRPANLPSCCPGTGSVIYDASGTRVLVISMLGSVFMPQLCASPFETADRILEENAGRYDVCVVDFHAEATSEKAAFARYLDSRASVVFGTHTHVQTNDARILPNGLGFITDAGMVGVHESILGVKSECILEKFLTQMPVRFEEPEGDIRFCGACFDIDTNAGGICTKAQAICIDGEFGP